MTTHNLTGKVALIQGGSRGIGAAIAWVANRKATAAKTAKSVHDTYKVMYEDVSTLLVETQKKYEENTKITEQLVAENNLTRRAVNRLSRAIEAIQLCPHRAACGLEGFPFVPSTWNLSHIPHLVIRWPFHR